MTNVLAIIVPWLVWGALDTGIYAALTSTFPVFQGTPPEAVWVLVVFLLLRAVYSYVAGYLAGRLAKGATSIVRIAVGLLFVTGVAAQITNWDMFPIWYHVVFLASIIPAALAGAAKAPAAEA